MIGIFGLLIGLIGATLLACGNKKGFSFFLASNLFMILHALQRDDMVLLAMMCAYTVTSIIGLCRK